MKDTILKLASWVYDSSPFVLATVIKTWGSAPRKVGAHMGVNERGEMIGSVSGGCVENDVVREALGLLKSGNGQLRKYGVTNERAWEVGLSCGGEVHILSRPFFHGHDNGADKEFWEPLIRSVRQNEGGVVLHPLSGAAPSYFPRSGLNGHAKAAEAFSRRANTILEAEDGDVFLEVMAPKPQLLIVGAAHVTTDLVQLAQRFGFETIVIDPRGFFAEKTLFPVKPDYLHNAWPEEILDEFEMGPYTFAVTLSHQPEIDDQALHHLLRADVAYIGALGSRRTHEKRVARLREAGFSEEEIAKIHAPVGLDINAVSAKEIALSIIAQVVQVHNQYC